MLPVKTLKRRRLREPCLHYTKTSATVPNQHGTRYSDDEIDDVLIDTYEGSVAALATSNWKMPQNMPCANRTDTTLIGSQRDNRVTSIAGLHDEVGAFCRVRNSYFLQETTWDT
jgi:hypothetical protein